MACVDTKCAWFWWGNQECAPERNGAHVFWSFVLLFFTSSMNMTLQFSYVEIRDLPGPKRVVNRSVLMKIPLSFWPSKHFNTSGVSFTHTTIAQWLQILLLQKTFQGSFLANTFIPIHTPQPSRRCNLRFRVSPKDTWHSAAGSGIKPSILWLLHDNATMDLQSPPRWH